MIKPPQHDACVVIKKRFRFKAIVALSEQQILQTYLLDMLAMPINANAAYRLAATARIRAIEVWGFNPTSGPPAEVAVEFNSATANIASSNKRYSDISVSSAYPAHIRAVPDRDAAASKWFAGTSNIAKISCPIGSIIDFEMDLVLVNGEAAVATRVISAGVAGTVMVVDLVANNIVCVDYAACA
jgi:hypothetical protein